MAKHLPRLSVFLIALGFLLVAAGGFARSNVTPIGAMDCGCGGAQACVTKRFTMNTGFVLFSAGGLCLLGGVSVGGYARMVRRPAT